MNSEILLVGNGINNLTNKQSWSKLVSSIITMCNLNDSVDPDHSKPFPLLYEEIYLKSSNITEFTLKQKIAAKVQSITQNNIHGLIREKQFQDIITTNYDYTLQGDDFSNSAKDHGNQGIVQESKYSLFRHNTDNGTRVWHIHGECNYPQSITLGYEHYAGQLQYMRNYVVSGTNYTNKKDQKPLARRLRNGTAKNESWIDFIFTRNIHILGLALDFVETDLWWLLTYRARILKLNQFPIKNRITYYIPEKYIANSRHKLDLLKAIAVEVICSKQSGSHYYQEILEKI